MSKQQTNKRIIVEEYLKSCYKIELEKMEKKVERTGRPQCSIWEYFMRTQELFARGEHNGFHIWDLDLTTGKISLEGLLTHIEIASVDRDFGLYFEKPIKISTKAYTPKDFGKEFFDYAKQRAEELGMPKSTFKTIKDTRERATQMLHEWWGQFGSIEEVGEWFDGSNDIMLK